jgi:hypothetical protein
MRTQPLREEKGIALILAILLLLILTLIGITSVNTSTYDSLISGHKRTSEQTFYVAEAGVNEFMGRFRKGVTGEITDNNPTDPDWKLFLAVNEQRAAGVGYVASNSDHIFYQSLQNQLDFGVEVRHKVDSANKVVTYCGQPIYVAKSYGFTANGGKKVVEVKINKSPNLDPPSAIYSKSPVTVRGTSTYIQGNDQCGLTNKTGIITTTSTINEIGLPVIDGSPSKEISSSLNLPLKEMVDYLKGDADFKYEYSANQILSDYSEDDYSGSWGLPTNNSVNEPLEYDGPMNITYFDMHGDKTIKFTGTSHGAGILLVNGNLTIEGGFSWYGVIIVTGALTYSGGGEKNVTGGIYTGESANVDATLGGNAVVIYCSKAIDDLNNKLPPLKMTQWIEIF